MSDNIFDVAVPDSELETPVFQPVPTGAYRTTLQAGAEIVGNGNGWRAIRIPFQGFRDVKSGKEYARAVRAQFTFESSSEQARQIGWRSIVGAAAAFGLTEPTVDAAGKAAQKPTVSTPEELIEQFNQMAGTEVEVYLTAKARMKGGQPVLKQDGQPYMDNEIKRVSAIKA